MSVHTKCMFVCMCVHMCEFAWLSVVRLSKCVFSPLFAHVQYNTYYVCVRGF
jgi:hypothetical protein